MKVFNRWSLVLCLMLPLWGSAQYFNKIYETFYDRTSRDVWRTQNGEYLICGVSNNPTPNDADLYIMRTDANGTLLWDTLYGGARPEYAYHMAETSDGKFIVVGYTQSFGPGDYDIYLLKIDANGKFIKHRNVNFGGKNEEARQILRTDDNKYLVIGTTGFESTSSKPDMVVLKIDEDLNDVETAKFFGGTDSEYGLAIAKTPDGGYYLAGQTRSKGAGRGDGYVVKVDANLAFQWDATYGDDLDQEVVGLVVDGDGSAMLAIRDSMEGAALDGNIEIMLQKISSGGAVAGAAVTYGGADKDTPKTIAPVGSGGYIVGAISRSWWEDAPQMWLIRTNADGTKQWDRFYGNVYEHDHCHQIKESHDGGFIVVGHQRQGAIMKIAFLKLTDAGFVGLSEKGLWSAGFSLFPNPSRGGSVNLRVSEPGVYDVSVSNIMGQEIYRNVATEFNEAAVTVILPACNAGIYIVNVKGEKGTLTRRVVVE